VAYRLVENFGATSRTQFGDDLKQIDQEERSKLRKLGVRFGEFTLFMPPLLKPAPAALLTLLWALWTERKAGEVPAPSAGRVSMAMSESLPHAYYYACGYRPSGVRAVRIDMLERLAGLIRAARNDATAREGFEASAQMMSLVGCSGEDFEAILRSLGFRKNVVKRKTAAPAAEAPADAAPAAEAAPAVDAAPEAPAYDAAAAAASPAAEEPSQERAPIQTDAAQPEVAQPAAEAAVEAPAPEIPAAEAEPVEAAADSVAPAADAPSLPADEIEVALWRPAPRRPRPAAKPAARRDDDKRAPGARREGAGDHRKPGQNAGQNANQNRGRGPKPDGRREDGFRKGGRRDDRGSRREDRNSGKGAVYTARPPREKKADPDSPFAILAGLKAELSNAQKNNKTKEPEKAE
jgi:ATP-dependent RNA helicase SUPV3L1/SUV3